MNDQRRHYTAATSNFYAFFVWLHYQRQLVGIGFSVHCEEMHRHRHFNCFRIKLFQFEGTTLLWEKQLFWIWKLLQCFINQHYRLHLIKLKTFYVMIWTVILWHVSDFWNFLTDVIISLACNSEQTKNVWNLLNLNIMVQVPFECTTDKEYSIQNFTLLHPKVFAKISVFVEIYMNCYSAFYIYSIHSKPTYNFIAT